MEASTSKPARQKSFTRRVSFNEDTILPPREHRRDYSDLESRIPINRRRRCRICGGLCDTCCFWISIVLGLLLLILLLCGGLYYGFLKSHMPEVRIQRLDVAAAELTVFLNATNGGGRTVLIYRRMIASVAASGFRSGVVRLTDVRQPPANSTLLEVAAAVEDRAARDMQIRAEAHVLVVDVRVKGRIDLIVGGRKMQGFPFKIECRSINLSEIDAGRAPPCRTELSPLRSDVNLLRFQKEFCTYHEEDNFQRGRTVHESQIEEWEQKTQRLYGHQLWTKPEDYAMKMKIEDHKRQP